MVLSFVSVSCSVGWWLAVAVTSKTAAPRRLEASCCCLGCLARRVLVGRRRDARGGTLSRDRTGAPPSIHSGAAPPLFREGSPVRQAEDGRSTFPVPLDSWNAISNQHRSCKWTEWGEMAALCARCTGQRITNIHRACSCEIKSDVSVWQAHNRASTRSRFQRAF